MNARTVGLESTVISAAASIPIATAFSFKEHYEGFIP